MRYQRFKKFSKSGERIEHTLAIVSASGFNRLFTCKIPIRILFLGQTLRLVLSVTHDNSCLWSQNSAKGQRMARLFRFFRIPQLTRLL